MNATLQLFYAFGKLNEMQNWTKIKFLQCFKYKPVLSRSIYKNKRTMRIYVLLLTKRVSIYAKIEK